MLPTFKINYFPFHFRCYFYYLKRIIVLILTISFKCFVGKMPSGFLCTFLTNMLCERCNCRMAGYPYLLRNLKIDRPNQVWSTDITYIPMSRGFMYLVAVMDSHDARSPICVSRQD